VDDRPREYEAIWRDVSPRLWRAVFAYTGGRREITDDVVVEAFARTMERDGDVRDPSAYLFRIAFRLAAVEVRGERGRAELEDAGVEDSHGMLDLLRALRHLTPAQRAAVYLHYEADLPVREVARAMGTSAAAVRVHLMRGRRRLASLLAEDPDV
jgi:RNA polymerase sigma factor (sigma-70 family)